MTNKEKSAFTLAEVLITLGIIGVVSAVTMPALITNIQDRVRKEQVRTVKYKLTKATDKMNSLGKIGHYNSTMDFVSELKKHLNIAKICRNNELDKCWSTESINAYQNGSTTLSEFRVKNLKQGSDLKALALGTKTTETVGIVTGDGVTMLLVYSPVCSGFDEAKTYTWSIEDGKPVTNAITNCSSAIFDINGAKGPNKIGQDVRTLNSIFGSVDLGTSYEPVGVNICNKMKQKYGFKYCSSQATLANNDRWVGGMYTCDLLGLRLPTMSTLANIANSRYGTTLIGPYTVYMDTSYYGENETCKQAFINGAPSEWYIKQTELICVSSTRPDSSSGIYDEQLYIITGYYWSNLEYSASNAYYRSFGNQQSRWDYSFARSNDSIQLLCVGD